MFSFLLNDLLDNNIFKYISLISYFHQTKLTVSLISSTYCSVHRSLLYNQNNMF
jgi:hypothetical protein